METIKGYLEAMFANMPNTDAVYKAKEVLLEMMEDKYQELINEGKSENEAVGTVISEFGNLDELADELGLVKEVQLEKEIKAEKPRKTLSFEAVSEYAKGKKKSALFIAGGTFLCIVSVASIIMLDMLKCNEAVGVVAMFGCILVAVGMFVYNGIKMKEFDHIKKEAWQIDKKTAEYFLGEKKNFATIAAIRKSIGVVLCAGCWLPASICDGLNVNENLGGALLFVLVGIGVFLIVQSNIVLSAYNVVLSINDKSTVSGNYGKQKNDMVYENDTVAAIMSIYWGIVTCLYLIWSFLTFQWGISWIIWPIAVIVRTLINSIYAAKGKATE